MQVLTFTLELLEPTLVLMLGSGDANQVESFGYIPGTVLRNTLAARFIADHDIQDITDDETQTRQCRQLFFNDQVCFLNAYPVNPSGQRTLPVPLSWQTQKEHLADFSEDRKAPLPIFDFSHDPIKADKELTAPRGVSVDFCVLAQTNQPEPTVTFLSAKKRVAMHNTRATRRVMAEGANNLFQYEALAAGEIFAGAILAQDGIDLKPLQQPYLSFGKSRSAGYGRVKLEFATAATPWSEYEPAQGDQSEFFVITLLSSVLIRDKNGAYTADISPALSQTGLTSDQLQPDRSIYKTEVVGGFNRKWNLHLPQTLAVQMGSVFVYSAQGVDRSQLARLGETGIGERRSEGFGRIAINWHRYSQLAGYKVEPGVIETPDSAQTSVSLELKDHSKELVKRIVSYQLRRQLDLALLKQITSLEIKGEPSRSQLSRVRLAARRALEKKSLAELQTFLSDIQGKAAHKALQRSRVGQQTLYEWLISHTNPQKIAEMLAGDDKGLGGVQINFAQETSLQIEYSARLVEGVIKQELDRQRLVASQAQTVDQAVGGNNYA